MTVKKNSIQPGSQRLQKTIKVGSAAESYLTLLGERGIRYLFGNGGTDFAPLLEAYSACHEAGRSVPRPVTVPHENIGVAMAHGYTMLTGEPQVVMTHVSVGSANAINGVFNASRGRIPLLLTAGRTPITEGGMLKGSRDFPIHWGQEMFDQAGMLRELVKWDYELRNTSQIEAVVDRAIEVAMGAPAGPVYLTLPREILAAEMDEFTLEMEPRRDTATPIYPNPDALAQVAALIADAEKPVIVTSDVGRDPGTMTALAQMVTDHAIGVVETFPSYLNLPTQHDMHLGFGFGFERESPLDDADLVVVLDCDAPWRLGQEDPLPHAKVIHIGLDPAYQNYPIHSFPRDMVIWGDSRLAVPLLADALCEATGNKQPHIDNRRKRLAALHADLEADWRSIPERVRDLAPIHPAWLSHCIEEVRGKNSILINEYPFDLRMRSISEPGSYFAANGAGGLGWGLGAALGAKLARPEKLVIAAVGDGSYMFGNPTPYHFLSRAEDLPTLTVISNNRRWDAVSLAAKGMYPGGRSVKSDNPPFTSLEPTPDYEHVGRASGAHAEKIEDPAELIPALERALEAMQRDGCQALLNVITAPSG